jgi:hypothetical protein
MLTLITVQLSAALINISTGNSIVVKFKSITAGAYKATICVLALMLTYRTGGIALIDVRTCGVVIIQLKPSGARTDVASFNVGTDVTACVLACCTFIHISAVV